jgi:hypothetical protein
MFTSVAELKSLSVHLSSNLEDKVLETYLTGVDELEIRPLLGDYYPILQAAFDADALSPEQSELVTLIKRACVRCVERDAAIGLAYKITNAGLGVYSPDGFVVKDGHQITEYFIREAAKALQAVKTKVDEITGAATCRSDKYILPIVMR